MQAAKGAYVATIRAIGSVARFSGLLRYLEGKKKSRACLYVRSLFSIYDAEDLARLDLPWWTFDAIEHVDAILRRQGREMVAFEYGSGASTLWLARRCRNVVSVEHDSEWAERTRALCAPHDNVEIRAVPPTGLTATTRCRSGRTGWKEYSFDDYVESIRRYPFRFDLIVVDGRCRAECLEEARNKLNEGGLIVFDNSNRRRYREACERLAMEHTVFKGLVPGLPFPGETTVVHHAKGQI
jgi:Methyltransferase domain